MKYLDPKADLTFKKIFGNHPDRLKNLLNSLQSLNEDELIQHNNICRQQKNWRFPVLLMPNSEPMTSFGIP